MSERTERTFLVQRYCSGNWPQVKGEIPFFATGPWFPAWGRGLERYGEWRFPAKLGLQFAEAYADKTDPLYYAAWALLETGIVQALWVEHSQVDQADWWNVAVEALMAEIPKSMPLAEAIEEYLSGLASDSHFRAYVSEDRINLIVMPCPGS